MNAPASYPVYMTKSGAPDMIVSDAISYQNALASGYAYAPVTPVISVFGNGGAAEQIDETPINPGQPDSVTTDQDQIS